MSLWSWLFGVRKSEYLCEHEWGLCILFQFRQNIYTGDIEQLIQCQKCGIIKHRPVSPFKVKELYQKWGIVEPKNDKNKLR